MGILTRPAERRSPGNAISIKRRPGDTGDMYVSALPQIADLSGWHQSPIRPDIEPVSAERVGAELVPAPAQGQFVAAFGAKSRQPWPSVVVLCFQHFVALKSAGGSRRS